MRVKFTKWVRDTLSKITQEVLGVVEQSVADTPQVKQAEVDATPVVKEYVPHWVELPEGKKVDINFSLISSNIFTGFRKFVRKYKYSPVALDTWTSPMYELFNLWRRDFNNIEITTTTESGYGLYAQVITCVTHKLLGISFTFDPTALDGDYFVFNNNTGLTNSEIRQLVFVCELFRFTKEYQRYLRIKSLSDVRAEKLAKELDEQEKIKYRNAQTNRIRDYLESKNENQ